MRNNQWLLQKTKSLWEKYFSDIPVKNEIIVYFARYNKRVLGSIRYHQKTKKTFIRLNGHFRNQTIPVYVVCATLAHELVHYTHGFSSPQQRLYYYPHRGGVVSLELRKRNLASLEKKSKKWLKNNWLQYLKK